MITALSLKIMKRKIKTVMLIQDTSLFKIKDIKCLVMRYHSINMLDIEGTENRPKKMRLQRSFDEPSEICIIQQALQMSKVEKQNRLSLVVNLYL